MTDHLWTPWRMPYLMRDKSAENGGCIFCDMAKSKEQDVERILKRGKHCFVTLNLYPYNNGHLMVIPNRHTSRLDDLDSQTLTELMTLTQQAIRALEKAYKPQGFNIGINQGEAAGAGIAAHLHQHIVPRWAGDTNFMTIIGETRTIPEWIDDTYQHLSVIWKELERSEKHD